MSFLIGEKLWYLINFLIVLACWLMVFLQKEGKLEEKTGNKRDWFSTALVTTGCFLLWAFSHLDKYFK